MNRFEGATLHDGTPVLPLRLKCSDEEFPYLVEAISQEGTGPKKSKVLQVNKQGQSSISSTWNLVMPEKEYTAVLVLHRDKFGDLVFKIFHIDQIEKAKAISDLKYIEVIKVNEKQFLD